jgi:hypothetical protein
MLQADLLDTLKNEFVTFSIEIDSQIKKLREKGLISPEEVERLKDNTEVYKEYLSRAFSEPSLDLVKQQLLQTYFNDYKETMTKTINKFWWRLYSDDNFKKQLNANLDQCYYELANRFSEQEREQLAIKIAQIKDSLWKKFKNELKKLGETNRYRIGERIIVQELPKTVDQIVILCSQFQTQLASNAQIVNNDVKNSSHSQRNNTSTQNAYDNKFDFFGKLGRSIDDVINNIFRSDN